MKEVITARGHEHVTAKHASTFEVTSDDYLTPAGDCILGLEADRTPASFADEFVAVCQQATATITVTFEAGGYTETVRGRGDPDLTFESERSMVWRTSEYVDDRTVGVEMERAAADLNRDLVETLASGAELTCTLSVE